MLNELFNMVPFRFIRNSIVAQNNQTQTHSGVSGHEAQEQHNAAKENTCVCMLREDTEILLIQWDSIQDSRLFPYYGRAHPHIKPNSLDSFFISLFRMQRVPTSDLSIVMFIYSLMKLLLMLDDPGVVGSAACLMPLKFCVRNAIEPTADISIFVRTHREVLFVIRN